jgi:redox-sensing transcriptional repressor
MSYKKENSKRVMPKPSIQRLCKVYTLLDEYKNNIISTISSKDIGKRLGVASHNIRKDISFLFGESGTIGSGYDIEKLKMQIEQRFGFNHKRNACIIGLDSLGTALLNQRLIINENFKILAGFDSNINRLETLKTDIALYPTHEITDVVRKQSIEFAVITDAGKEPASIIDRLINGGIRGIVNLSSTNITTDRRDIYISNFDLIGEFRYLVALLSFNSEMIEKEGNREA